MQPIDLGATSLRSVSGEIINAASLWTSNPVLVVCLRRPGCLLCREEAIHLWNEREKFESMGIRMVCILHEWRDQEVEAFHPAYWGGELFFDEAKNFHATVHGGKIKRGNVLDLLNPFSRAYKNMRRAKDSNTVKDSNLIGDGMTMGGVMIISTGGKIEYAFPEATFGDHAPFEELLAAAKKAAGK